MVALSKHFKRSNLAQKILHAWVKKCHFGNFSEKAGMAVPCQCGPQKCILAFEKLFLFWVPMNIQKDWKAKLESAYSFMLQNRLWICSLKNYYNHFICSEKRGYKSDARTIFVRKCKPNSVNRTGSVRMKSFYPSLLPFKHLMCDDIRSM